MWTCIFKPTNRVHKSTHLSGRQDFHLMRFLIFITWKMNHQHNSSVSAVCQKQMCIVQIQCLKDWLIGSVELHRSWYLLVVLMSLYVLNKCTIIHSLHGERTEPYISITVFRLYHLISGWIHQRGLSVIIWSTVITQCQHLTISVLQ